MHTRCGIRALPAAACLLLLLLFPSVAAADLTAFIGVNATPNHRPVRGLAVGAGLVVVGIEVEYSETSEDLADFAPALRTVMVNGLVQTPVPIAGMQFYATAGGGVFRESLREVRETHVGVNVGGGVKVSLLGPLRLRLDYRVFTLRGEPLHANPQRFYAGLNLKF